MAEFLLTQRDTEVIAECLEIGLQTMKKRPGAGNTRKLMSFIRRLNKTEFGDQTIYLELPDIEQLKDV